MRPVTTIVVALSVLSLTGLRHASTLSVIPDPSLTPGSVRTLTTKQVCERRWGLAKDERMVTTAMRKRVADRYNFAWADRKQVEFDHLIPRCIGGADVEDNLWPQRLTGDWNAYVKDKVERKACVEVCAGRLRLQDARRYFRTDWTVLYHKFYGSE